MSEQNSENLSAKVAELETKLDITLDVVGRLVKALDHLRDSDARFIFELDLVKHSLSEAGYAENPISESQEYSSPSRQLEP